LAKAWSGLTAYLMGELCLVMGARIARAERLPGKQGRLAAAYLLIEQRRPVSRDELADVLWPESLPRSFDVALSAIVSKLRAVLAELGMPRDTLTVAAGCYQFHLPQGSWVDVAAAITSVHLAEGALLAGRHGDAYGPAVVACSILRRPFLPGADGAWIETQRRSLRAAQLRALDCLAEVHEWNGEHALALRAASEAVELEPYRESGYRRLMQLHEQGGDPAEAMRVYEHLAAVLEAELHTTPGPQTKHLAERLSKKPQKVLKI
jgi:SARP family transcriptional regulator, regulator of embCAB operon